MTTTAEATPTDRTRASIGKGVPGLVVVPVGLVGVLIGEVEVGVVEVVVGGTYVVLLNTPEPQVPKYKYRPSAD